MRWARGWLVTLILFGVCGCATRGLDQSGEANLSRQCALPTLETKKQNRLPEDKNSLEIFNQQILSQVTFAEDYTPNADKVQAPAGGALAWNDAYALMAYLNLYRATGKDAYLEKFVSLADKVLGLRDDRAGAVDYEGKSQPSWSYPGWSKPVHFVAFSGMLSYPLADFAQLIHSRPALQAKQLSNGKTLQKIADDFRMAAEETVLMHESEWDAEAKTYRFQNSEAFKALSVEAAKIAGTALPYNQQHALGRTIVALNRISTTQLRTQRIQDMLAYFKKDLTVGARCTYEWHYAENGRVEDIAHGAISVDFARLAVEQHYEGMDELDLALFARTISKNVLPFEGRNKVAGEEIKDGRSQMQNLTFWLPLSKYAPEIYYRVWNSFLSSDSSKNVFSRQGKGAYALIGLSYLLEYRSEK